MIPAYIKAFYLKPAFGVGLCVVTLFLIGNTMYLNTVLEKKTTTADMMNQGIALYDTQLKQLHQLDGMLPQSFSQHFYYGSFLKDIGEAFSPYRKTLELQTIWLTEEAKAIKQRKSVSTGRNKKEVLTIKTLHLSGLMTISGNTEPYLQLNTVISQIKDKTQCQLSLKKAGSEQKSFRAEETLQPIYFELLIAPETQPHCTISTQPAKGSVE
jgi:hypothetical protein